MELAIMAKLMRNCCADCAPSYLKELWGSVSSIPGRRFLGFGAEDDLVVHQLEGFLLCVYVDVLP